MHLFIFWTISILDLAFDFRDKMQEFQWELIVHPLLLICFYFAMRDEWSLSQRKSSITILIIFTLN